jgi:FAD/FMN-containing dehydrogenase
VEKNTAGYAIAQEPLDWFIGSEGTLGVLLDLELSLVPRPENVVGLAIPFPTEALALAFVAAARETSDLSPRCLEYFDATSLDIARAADGERFQTPAGATLVYAEQACATDALLDAWLAAATAHGAVIDDLVVFEGDSGLVRARAMRHAVPAAMNERGALLRAAGGRKVSTDWAVPYRQLSSALVQVREIAAQHGWAPAVTYGHAGNGHPHQNYLARDHEELKVVERVVEETLARIIERGGTISAEHGIGKLKRRWLPLQLKPMQIELMRSLKHQLDPRGILAPGNVL